MTDETRSERSEGRGSVRIDAVVLRKNVIRIFRALGLDERNASMVAHALIEADLMGVSTHGVSNYILMLYAPLLRSGACKAQPDMKIVRESPTMALVDGDRGMGHVVATRAMRLAIEKAKTTGIGIVAVRGSMHFGAAGVYAKMALQHDMIGLATTNADQLMVPLHGRESRFGTNPIAVAVPTGEEPPFHLDMATSTVPLGRIMLKHRAGEALEEGWATDEQGQPTRDAGEAFEARRLLPLGGDFDHGGHKGQGLAMVVDIVSGLLSGAGVLSQVSVEGEVGHFFAAMKVDGLRDIDTFKMEMDAFVRAICATPQAPGVEPVIYAGVKEARARVDRLENGIPLHEKVVEDLSQLAAELNVRWLS